MLSSLEVLRDDVSMRRLLGEYRHRQIQQPESEWHHRVMELVSVDMDRLSRMHGYLIASGWIDVRVERDAFGVDGGVLDSYRITKDGLRALISIESEQDLEMWID